MPKLATFLATVGLLGALSGTAHATDGAVSTTWVTDGPVTAVAYDSAGRAYLGGEFQYVGPRLGSGIALTTTSAVPAASVPDINGYVLAAVSDSAGGTFIGGNFTSVGGVPRARIAHLLADGTLDANWNPGAKSTVRALALSPDGASLYAGGDFSGANAIGGAARSRLAKLSAATGAVDPDWDPSATGSVRALVATGSAVYAGGSFGDVDGTSPPRLAKLDAGGSGAVDATWAPVVFGPIVNALALSGNDLFVGGLFFQVNGTGRAGLAKVASGGTGTLDATWNPDPTGGVNALQLSGSDLFVGGDFLSVGGQNRAGLAKLSTTGAGPADASWNPADPGTTVDSLALAGSELLAGGDFFSMGGNTELPHLAKLATGGTGAAAAWTPNPNGRVRAIAVSGSSVFAGGDFSSAGSLNTYRGSLVRLNANGSLDTTWTPVVVGNVEALSLEGTELIVGGIFADVGAVTRHSLAKLSTTDGGALDATWNPGVSGQVNALARSGDSLFVGGSFLGVDSIGGEDRNNIAKLSASGAGTVDPTWNPNASGAVSALAVSGGDLFVGGQFFDVGGQPRSRLAKLSAADTGAADATWDPDPSGNVNALVVSGSSLYVGGAFTGLIGGQSRNRLAKLSTGGTGDADASWAPQPNAPVSALALSGGDLYAGGIFATIGGQPRNRLARLSAATGTVDPAFDPAPSTDGGGVAAVAATGTRVLAGGQFTSIGALSTANVAVFDLTSPTLSLTSPFEGARYRQGQNVAAAFTCDDPDGPIDALSCTGTVPSGSAIDTATPGAKTFTATATDSGGRSASSTVNYFVDGSAPDITISTPAQDAVYSAGTTVPVQFACADADGAADVASCTGTAPAGSQLKTSKDGTHKFTVTSADLVGNTSTKTVTYRVTGNPPVLSALKIKPGKFKAGRGARVTFKLSKAATVTFKVSGKTSGSFSRKAKRGKNAFKFRGKVKGKTLPPGAYRMVASAKAPNLPRSKAVARAFRIVKG